MAKRSAQGSGNIRKKVLEKNGKQYVYWEARVTLGRDPGTGKQLQKSFTGKTQKEVRQKLQSAAIAVDDNSYFEPSKMTLGGWLDVWLKEYTSDKKYGTVKSYRAQVETHIKPALGNVKLSELRTPHIQAFYNALLKTGRTVKAKGENGLEKVEQVPLSVKSVRNVHGILTKALNTAVDVDLLKTNPAARATLPKMQRKEMQPLTDEQIKEFLKIAPDDVYGRMLKTILFTGLRESECIGLTWDNINFNEGTITVCKQLQKRPKADGGFTFAPLKNDKARKIKPAPFVMDILRAEKKRQLEKSFKAREFWQAWNNAAEQRKALVFTTDIGSNISPQTLYNHYKKLASEIGAPDSRVHDLRHTYAVLSLQNGDDLKTVQGNLGHATASFTLDVYGHVSERMKDDSSQRMQKYITGVS